MTEEIWKDITGYEGLYQVSNLGRVKSLYDGGHKCFRYLILKPSINNGYLYVKLTVNGKCKSKAIHRLVAEAFIPNPDNLEQINHIDENKQNNNIENLEWCTRSYNLTYGTRIRRFKETIGIKVKMYDLKTKEEKLFCCIQDVANYLNTNHRSIRYSMTKYKKPYKNRFIFTEINKEKETLT